jgi:hypothetical protein
MFSVDEGALNSENNMRANYSPAVRTFEAADAH